jgi:glycosyltransferase involved in cell wall biosynthesis
MKILHITSWHPTQENPLQAIWIKKHIGALGEYQNNVIHLEHIPTWYIMLNSSSENGVKSYKIKTPSWSWFITEILISIVLFYSLILKKRAEDCDLINFHIAYPNLTYWHIIKRWVRKPVLITEHWSAYHFSFGVKKELPRIKRIFRQNIPVIAVSKALKNDILKFSGGQFDSYIVPNIVDPELFYPDNSIERKKVFFMVSQWNYPKKPMVALIAFKEFHKSNPDYKLIVAGYGTYWQEMNNWIVSNNLQDSIEMLGPINQEEIANHLRSCKAFIHPSEYETFSVVCAEAVSCSTPVLSSKVGGIPEVVKENGILVEGFEITEWVEVLKKVVNFKLNTEDQENRFYPEQIAKLYKTAIAETVEKFQG